MTKEWIVVADAARARIFDRAARDSALQQIHVLTHPESEAHPGDLRTGGKGEIIESSGAATRQSDPHVTTMEKQAEDFAREVAESLRKSRAAGKYDALVLVAEPRFLGRLRANLDSATTRVVEREIDKNWAQHEPRQIDRLLEKYS